MATHNQSYLRIQAHKTWGHPTRLLAGCQGMQRDGADAASLHRCASSDAPNLYHGVSTVWKNYRSTMSGSGYRNLTGIDVSPVVVPCFFFKTFNRHAQPKTYHTDWQRLRSPRPPCFHELKCVLSHRGNSSLLDEARVHGRKIG